MAYLLSNRDEKADLTSLLVYLPKGTQVEKHIHENSDDIVYVIKGKATMWIENRGCTDGRGFIHQGSQRRTASAS